MASPVEGSREDLESRSMRQAVARVRANSQGETQ